ncbi:hypothetical protein CALVIDRAFT_538100 [Calocera viscosa TUFC12733]|uniref:Ribosomal protein/NADH dehydrogenase domain-containing protein n=1 Tax=Calocera viscosa (strain TUFC12733) TaxID=1330018 RepID=A0A167L4D6_CALVF|nr:hypothetical protein CALVIDRAFT_538100 [Calocera viscosa TUFC12733]
MSTFLHPAKAVVKHTPSLTTKPTTVGKALKKLTPPVPLQEGVKRVTLVYNKDAHAAARRFARDVYPRVVYSNKHIAFTTEPLPKPPQKDAGSPPEWVLTFEDGKEKRLRIVGMQPKGILGTLVNEVGWRGEAEQPRSAQGVGPIGGPMEAGRSEEAIKA